MPANFILFCFDEKDPKKHEKSFDSINLFIIAKRRTFNLSQSEQNHQSSCVYNKQYKLSIIQNDKTRSEIFYLINTTKNYENINCKKILIISCSNLIDCNTDKNVIESANWKSTKDKRNLSYYSYKNTENALIIITKYKIKQIYEFLSSKNMKLEDSKVLNVYYIDGFSERYKFKNDAEADYFIPIINAIFTAIKKLNVTLNFMNEKTRNYEYVILDDIVIHASEQIKQNINQQINNTNNKSELLNKKNSSNNNNHLRKQDHFETNYETDSFIKVLTLSNLYQDIMNYIYSQNAFKKLGIFASNNIFQTYSRLSSYAAINVYSLINPHSNAQMMEHIIKRDIHPLTLQLFDVYNFSFSSSTNSMHRNNINNKQCLINNFNEFSQELTNRFYYNKWKDLINWDHFVLAGGSALKCILKNTFISNNSDHDIDLFAYRLTKYEFYEQVRKFSSRNCEFTIEYFCRDQRHYDYNKFLVHTAVLNFDLNGDDPQIVKLQFIWRSQSTPESILNNFDLDCCQVAFIGDNENHKAKCLCTFAFIQSISTETMICYKLINNKLDLRKNINRICKYAKRGFNKLLIPKGFNINILSEREFMNEKDYQMLVKQLNNNLVITNDKKQTTQKEKIIVNILRKRKLDNP